MKIESLKKSYGRKETGEKVIHGTVFGECQ